MPRNFVLEYQLISKCLPFKIDNTVNGLSSDSARPMAFVNFFLPSKFDSSWSLENKRN